MKNWRTTLFGAIFSMGSLATGAGISVGHIGNVDAIQAATSIAALLLGFYAKDHTNTGTGA